MKFNVDVVRIRENSIQLNGWAIGKTPDAKIAFDVEDEARHSLEAQVCPDQKGRCEPDLFWQSDGSGIWI